ncbi:hypothetical protein STEG23_036895, partial [Scotinomys teguina]
FALSHDDDEGEETSMHVYRSAHVMSAVSSEINPVILSLKMGNQKLVDLRSSLTAAQMMQLKREAYEYTSQHKLVSTERKALIAKFSGSDQPVGRSELVRCIYSLLPFSNKLVILIWAGGLFFVIPQVPRVMVTPNHKITSLLLHDCDLAAVMNCNGNI